MKTKINTAKAWGYLCRDRNGKFTLLAEYAGHAKAFCANLPVRVRVIRERDYQRLAIAELTNPVTERGDNEK